MRKSLNGKLRKSFDKNKTPNKRVTIQSNRKTPNPSLKSKKKLKKKKSKNKNEIGKDHEKKNSVIGTFIVENGIKKHIIPVDDQLDLNKDELEVEFDRLLEAKNPNAPQNIAYFNFTEDQYKFEATVEQTAFHLKLDSTVINVETMEGKKQLRREEEKKKRQNIQNIPEGEVLIGEEKNKNEDEMIEEVQGHVNQFNFCERSTQTMNYPLKETGVSTKPPLSMKLQDTVTQWGIYDTYIKEIQDKKIQQEKSEKKNKKKDQETETETFEEIKPQKKNNINELGKTLKFMERMVLQNEMEEIYDDVKYWNDENGIGKFLPLWEFKQEKYRNKRNPSVTSLKWNTQYNDLFAVGYGSYDFLKQSSGMVTCYSLKNTKFPEYKYIVKNSGVMSIDFHPKHSPLLVAGLYNGNILLFDIRQPKPIAQTTSSSGKHSDVVWDVSWDREAIEKGFDFNFFSVSSDSTVKTWNLKKNEFEFSEALYLRTDSALQTKSLSSNKLKYSLNRESGTCFHFHPHNPKKYLVGTEEGFLHECSKSFTSQYLQTYNAHHLNIYSCKWNHFGDVFATSGADWTVKIWKSGEKNHLYNFDLGSGVGDIDWAPYSSTLLAAVTNSGRVHIFDLNVNKNDSITNQLVVKKAKLTKITFNPTEKIILVGDDKGCVQTFKLPSYLSNLQKKVELNEGETEEQAQKRILNSICQR